MELIAEKSPVRIQGVLLVLLLSVVGVIADAFLKRASLQGSPFLNHAFLIGTLIYASSAFAWVMAMQHLDLAVLGACYSVATVLMLTAVGVFYFGETLRPRDIVGLVLGTLSLVLLTQ